VIETLPLQQLEVPIVTWSMFRLMRWLAEPLKVSVAFWPGVEIVTVTGEPPGVIVPFVSAGTL
jgi:hypothetical protein